ncbi:hypothetical protein NM208_g2178 [Fusarium decemcellulare]|uniref:Uncharacterized protein n=1 Tax=Fusarium decemcellulare TaxID=57161 RepID=A0ACC1STL0_9HYPO|nr:hypothetical protein NM208_g2178 [Fusarium decemcellulare]
MKFALLVSSLASLANAAFWTKSCSDPFIKNFVLHGDCNKLDGSVSSASLDLNSCFAFDGDRIISQGNGNIGDSCEDCWLSSYSEVDEAGNDIGERFEMTCACPGKDVPRQVYTAAIDLPIDNYDGQLIC